jgi:hypothetical protein
MVIDGGVKEDKGVEVVNCQQNTWRRRGNLDFPAHSYMSHCLTWQSPDFLTANLPYSDMYLEIFMS